LSWRLIGRDRELDLIEEYRRRGDGAVVLAGDAGVGKSRLAREALARFEPGAQIYWVQATRSAASVPLGAFAGVLPDSTRSEDPLELLRLSVQSLGQLGAERQVVLGIDDAHLLDPSSAALVLELAVGSAVFVVITIRVGEPCEDAVISVWKDSGAARVALEALDRSQTESLAEEIVGGPIEQSARRWIYDTSLGNALYVRELVLGALAGGALVEVHGLWRMANHPPVSASLSELIAARMIGLTPACARAMELLALGEPLRVSELISLTGEEPLVEIEARGLTSISDAGGEAEVRLSHPLYGEAIRAELPAFRRQQRQLELAETLHGRDELQARDLLRVTRWLTDAEQQVPVEMLLQAGIVANRSGDPALGAQLAEHALAAGAGIDGALLLARTHILRSHYLEAETILRAAEPLVGDQATAVSYLDQRTTVLYWGLRRSDELRVLLDRARTWWEDAEWQRHLDALGLLSVDRCADSADVAGSAQVYADQSANPELRRRAAPAHAFNLFLSGQVHDAYDLARGIRTRAPLADLTDQMRFGLWSRIALESGIDWGELERWNAAAFADGVRLGDHAAAGRGALVLANLRFSEGRFAQASRWLAEAELHLERRDAGGLLTLVNSLRVGVACFTGDLQSIDPALERCQAAYGNGDPLPSELPYVARARGWALRAHGDLPRAQALLLDAAERLHQMPIYAARLTYEALRAGAKPRQLTPRLQNLAQACDTPLTSAYAAHATARSAEDGNGLMQVSDEMQSIGTLRYAAEAAADAASSYLAAGRQDAGRRAAVRSRELHAIGENGLTPTIVGLDPDRMELTARERQLIELAARGLSNTEIAAQLVLSVRTVESHLYRAMRKLGINSRHQLKHPHPEAMRAQA
jgi:DNA-binding CsgD family transcriptional regulator/DNA replicative helicase MCM subunit Mcm2 (Cdc46/Mcm family)